MRALAGRLALALVLLVAWQAALGHPIEHVDELGELVHVHDGHAHGEEREPGALCDLFASLTACAAGTPLLPSGAERVVHLFASGRTGAPRVAEAPPFLSQGPPVPV